MYSQEAVIIEILLAIVNLIAVLRNFEKLWLIRDHVDLPEHLGYTLNLFALIDTRFDQLINKLLIALMAQDHDIQSSLGPGLPVSFVEELELFLDSLNNTILINIFAEYGTLRSDTVRFIVELATLEL